MMRFVMAVMLAVMALSGAAQAADIKAGEKVFKKCKACHVVDKEKNRTGPHLVGIIGRPAASVESYKKYSKALKESGFVWDVATLDGSGKPEEIPEGWQDGLCRAEKAKGSRQHHRLFPIAAISRH